MLCECGGDTKVYDSRLNEDGNILRRRECKSCGCRFGTLERRDLDVQIRSDRHAVVTVSAAPPEELPPMSEPTMHRSPPDTAKPKKNKSLTVSRGPRADFAPKDPEPPKHWKTVQSERENNAARANRAKAEQMRLERELNADPY